MKARRRSDGKIIEVREWRGASDVIYSLPDMNQFYQVSDLDFDLDADTVIQGWVAIDEAYNQCLLHTEKPIQKALPITDTGDYDTVWDSKGETYLIDAGLFPDMDSDSEPQEVEIIIKRKK